jgi:hypothetical protein
MRHTDGQGMTIAEVQDSEKSPHTKVSPPPKLNGVEWGRLSPLLTDYRSISSLARDVALPEAVVEEVLNQHATKVRKSMVNSPDGSNLYIRRDTGLIPRLRELAALSSLNLR